jgi:2-keto-4-pentenoate hydratase/2-oxohepta-3-ene-1,7-dioic acid hydratase in catechol pathway
VISKEHERVRTIKQAESPVLIPKGVECHYEVELAVIVRNDLTNLSFLKKQLSPKDYEATWKSAIAGYAIGTLPILLTDSYQPSI